MDKAIEFYKKAVDLGNSTALFNLGMFHYYGQFIEKNYSQSFQYYKSC